MKKICVGLCLFFGIFGLTYDGAFAQVKPVKKAETPKISFGFTNISKALMLHPTMAHYKIKEGRFAPVALKEKTTEPAGSRLKEFEANREKVLAEKKLIDEKIEKADKDFSEKFAKLNVKYGKKSSAKVSDEYNKEKNLLENKFWAERQELLVKRTDIENKLKKLNDENTMLHLTSHEETERVFGVMLDDVYEAVNQVAEHYKVDVVFNSSFSVERTPVNPSFTPVNPMDEFFAMKPNRDAKEFLVDHGPNDEAPFAMTLDYWLACQRWAFRTTSDPRLDKMFLKGGLDMTPAVIDLIYQKHKISAAHRDVIQEFLKNHN